MRASVVIATYNRAESLRVTLDGLRHQTFGDFEVVLVAGPSSDETPALLAEFAGELKAVTTDERNLCVSRNLGTDAAAGDVVAFIDDDAIPEPSWLKTLLDAYADPAVGGAGGVVYDHTGVRLQYRFSLCDRLGRGIYDRVPEDEHNRRGADPFVYLQGTNMSFRREALEQIRGFDEHIEYVWDEADLALRLLDAGWSLCPVDGAPVHHKLLASSLRRAAGLVTDPYAVVKNRVYFALRNGLGGHGAEEVFDSLVDWTRGLREAAGNATRRGELSAHERAGFEERLEAGFDAGFELGMHGDRRVRALVPPKPETFRTFAVRTRAVPRTGWCLLAAAPPTAAVSVAADDVHVVTPAGDQYRIDFEHGAWVHRIPVGPRQLPALDGHPLRDRLAAAAAFWWATHMASARTSVQVVSGSADDTLVCAMDPRWKTVDDGAEPLEATVARALAESPPSTDAEAAEHAVRAGVQQLLEQAGGVEDLAEAVAQLLEPSAFPFDYLAALAPLEDASDIEFVKGVYQLVLERTPEPKWLEAALDPLRQGLKTRTDIVHEIATSEEASVLGVDASFADRLPREFPRILERRIRDAFWRDDLTFAQRVTDTLLGPDEHGTADAVRARLSAGATRRGILRELVDRDDIRARVPAAPALLARTFMTRDELRDRLIQLSDANDAEFVAGAYRLLLERDPDPDAASWRRELTRASRRWVVVGIAFSGEAQRRGIDPSVVNVIAEEIPTLNEPPLPAGAEGKMLRTVRAVQDLGRRRSASDAPD